MTAELRQYFREHPPVPGVDPSSDPVAFRLAERALCLQKGMDPDSATEDDMDIRDSDEWFEEVETLVRQAARDHQDQHSTRQERIIRRNAQTPAVKPGHVQPSGSRQEVYKENFEDLYVTVEASLDHIMVTFDANRATPIPLSFVHTPTDDEMLQCAQEVYGRYFNTILNRIRDIHRRQSPLVVVGGLVWKRGSEGWDDAYIMYSYGSSE